MTPRERTTRFVCAEPDCRESVTYAYRLERERVELYRDNQRRPYKCSRHRDPAANLRPDNTVTTHVRVATKVPYSGGGFLDGLYWLPEGATAGGSGFAYGPGFTAYADDFPEGTRLTIAASIEMPGEGATP